MIVMVFVDGDQKVLKNFLLWEVYEGFSVVIDDWEKWGEMIEFIFVGIDKVEIVEVVLKGMMVQVIVKIYSQLILVICDMVGEVVDGDLVKVMEVIDIWIFVCDIVFWDLNWWLVVIELVE